MEVEHVLAGANPGQKTRKKKKKTGKRRRRAYHFVGLILQSWQCVSTECELLWHWKLSRCSALIVGLRWVGRWFFSQTPEQVRVKSSSECCSGKFTKQIYADANVLLCKWISSSLPHFGLNKCNGTELHSCEWESNYIIAYLLFKWQRFSKVHMLESVIIF